MPASDPSPRPSRFRDAATAVPVSFFGIVLGLAGLGGCWRLGHQAWGLPAAVGELLMLAAALVWAVLALLYAAKWLTARGQAAAEILHPVQCCFAGLAGVATMLVGLAALPYSAVLAWLLATVGGLFTLAFGLWRTGALWRGEREPAATTPILYLPTVAGFFVTAIAAAGLGRPDWGQLAFGAGLFSWLAIESVLLHRLYTAPTLPPPLRPTLGIQLAPPSVGAVAYAAVTAGPPDLLAHGLIGYGLLQALLLLRLYPWIRAQPFGASYWAFTFGATALAAAPLRLMARGETSGPVAVLAPWLFAAANLVVLAVAAGTVVLLARGRLLPPPPAAPAPAPPPSPPAPP